MFTRHKLISITVVIQTSIHPTPAHVLSHKYTQPHLFIWRKIVEKQIFLNIWRYLQATQVYVNIIKYNKQCNIYIYVHDSYEKYCYFFFCIVLFHSDFCLQKHCLIVDTQLLHDIFFAAIAF